LSAHFDLAIALDLKPDTPQQVLDTLRYLMRTEDYDFDNPPDHEFFTRWDDQHWRNWMPLAENSTYSPGEAGSSLRRVYRYTQHGQDVYRYTFSFRCWMLDDGFYEWWPFAKWLALHSHTSGYVGYYREEFDLHPTLIYFREANVYTLRVTGDPIPIRGGKPWQELGPIEY